MTDNEFIGMTVKQIANTIFNDTKTVEQVDAVFEALELLDADKSRQVVDAVEKLAVADIDVLIKMIKEDGEIPAKDLDRMGQALPEYIAESQANSHVYVRVAQSKGDTADPLTKAIAQEIHNMSREDYNRSLSKLMAVPVNAYNAVAAQKAAVKAGKPARPHRHGM